MHYSNNKDSRKKAEEALKKYDLGIEQLGKKGDVIHRFNDKTFSLQMHEESSGTQQLFSLLKMLDNVLKKGSVAIIDEFDALFAPLHAENANKAIPRRRNKSQPRPANIEHPQPRNIRRIR